MTKEIEKIDNDKKLPPLSHKQALTLMAMLSSNSDQEAISKCPYSIAQFYRLKPLLIRYKEEYLNNSVEKSLDMLKALSPKAVQELGDELEHRDVKVKNKAANDILDKALPKKPTTAIGIQGDDMKIEFIGGE